MSDEAISPPIKRKRLDESTSDLEISPVLTESSQDKSADSHSIEIDQSSSYLPSFQDTKVNRFSPRPCFTFRMH